MRIGAAQKRTIFFKKIQSNFLSFVGGKMEDESESHVIFTYFHEQFGVYQFPGQVGCYMAVHFGVPPAKG